MSYRLHITRCNPHPYGPVTATIDGLNSRRELTVALNDNLRTTKVTDDYIRVDISESSKGNVYSGTVAGLRGKRL
jgi:hypothetical protein